MTLLRPEHVGMTLSCFGYPPFVVAIAGAAFIPGIPLRDRKVQKNERICEELVNNRPSDYFLECGI